MDDPQRFEGGPTGRRRRSSSSSPPAWFGVPFVAAGLLAVGLGIGLLRDELRFGDTGTSVQGSVVSTRFHPGDGDSGDSYSMQYAFTDASGLSHGGSSGISESQFRTLRPGDRVEVAYLATDPATNRLGKPEPQLLQSLAVMGVGTLFAVVGSTLVASAVRSRRLRPATPSAQAGMGPGPNVLTVDVPRSQVETFTRPPIRVVVDLVLAPIGALGFLGFAIFGVSQIGSQPFFIVGVPLLLFFSFTMFMATLAGIRRGISLRVAEVGPAGIWSPDFGRLAWSDIESVRIENNRGIGSSNGESSTVGVDDVSVGSRSASTTQTYVRLGIVPKDPAVARRGRFGWSVVNGFIRLVNTLRPSARLTDMSSLAPLGIQAYELEQPFEELVRSVRRFTAVAEPGSAPAPVTANIAGTFVAADQAETASAAAPGGQATTMPADLPTRTFDRRGWTSGGVLELVLSRSTSSAPPIVGVAILGLFDIAFIILPLWFVGSILVSGGLQMPTGLLFLIVPVVFAAIGWRFLRGLRAQWRMGTGDPELLSVGPAGLAIHGDPPLPWSRIASIRSKDGSIYVAPVDPTDDGGRLLSLDLNLLEADPEEVLDHIARFRVVDEID